MITAVIRAITGTVIALPDSRKRVPRRSRGEQGKTATATSRPDPDHSRSRSPHPFPSRFQYPHLLAVAQQQQCRGHPTTPCKTFLPCARIPAFGYRPDSFLCPSKPRSRLLLSSSSSLPLWLMAMLAFLNPEGELVSPPGCPFFPFRLPRSAGLLGFPGPGIHTPPAPDLVQNLRSMARE